MQGLGSPWLPPPRQGSSLSAPQLPCLGPAMMAIVIARHGQTWHGTTPVPSGARHLKSNPDPDPKTDVRGLRITQPGP